MIQNKGLVLAVRRDFGLELMQYDQSEWFLAGPIEGTSKKNETSVTMLALSVYIPCTGESDRQVSKQAVVSHKGKINK
jgi:hypothetical protein